MLSVLLITDCQEWTRMLTVAQQERIKLSRQLQTHDLLQGSNVSLYLLHFSSLFGRKKISLSVTSLSVTSLSVTSFSLPLSELCLVELALDLVD